MRGQLSQQEGTAAVATQMMGLILEQHRHVAELSQLAAVRQAELARLMSQVPHPQRPMEATDDVLALEGADAVREWLVTAADSAEDEAVAFTAGGSQSPESMARGRVLDEQALARGVRMRSIYLSSAARDPATRRHVNHLVGAGAEIRMATTLPLRMIVVDRSAALLPLRLNHSASGAIVLRNGGIISALHALFEKYWDAAAVFGSPQEADDGDLTDQQRLALRMLSQGREDEEIAVALGVSVRTVRRMLSALAERLGARSRFQAGVNAVRAGWLD